MLKLQNVVKLWEDDCYKNVFHWIILILHVKQIIKMIQTKSLTIIHPKSLKSVFLFVLGILATHLSWNLGKKNNGSDGLLRKLIFAKNLSKFITLLFV